MLNITRRHGQQEQSNEWAPYYVLRDLLGLDPFAEMAPAARRREGDTFSPSFEVKGTTDAYVFKADLPGVEEANLDITLTGNRLTVSGTRQAEARQEGETFYAYERSYGSFSRSFTLPDGIDADRVAAELKGGVLTVSVPKRPENQPRKVSVKTVSDPIKGAFGGKDGGQA